MQPVKIKVFIATMFDDNPSGADGETSGEFYHWHDRYWKKDHTQILTVRGAAHPVFCNADGVCGAVLGVGKVRASSSMQAILLDPRFDFSEAYFIISGVAGAPPSRATIGSVVWGSWLVDFDLGMRWHPRESPNEEMFFSPREGDEDMRVFRLNPDLVAWAMALSAETPLLDSAFAQSFRARYPQKVARSAPFVGVGTHMSGDCFFHGPGLSEQAQEIAKLYGADDYMITEMEGTAIAHVIRQLHGIDRLLSLRVVVNFDQGTPDETTLYHLKHALEQVAGDFAESVKNKYRVGSRVVDHIVNHWQLWHKGVPSLEVGNQNLS
ncbi:MAG: purine nucleoside permease [Burkholderiales bacterium]|jgi:purine nucleoside permease|nr:purine nucleoside permease [Burkholderiales bacterium]